MDFKDRLIIIESSTNTLQVAGVTIILYKGIFNFLNLPPNTTTYADKVEVKVMTHLWRITKSSKKFMLSRPVTKINDPKSNIAFI